MSVDLESHPGRVVDMAILVGRRAAAIKNWAKAEEILSRHRGAASALSVQNPGEHGALYAELLDVLLESQIKQQLYDGALEMAETLSTLADELFEIDRDRLLPAAGTVIFNGSVALVDTSVRVLIGSCRVAATDPGETDAKLLGVGNGRAYRECSAGHVHD